MSADDKQTVERQLRRSRGRGLGLQQPERHAGDRPAERSRPAVADPGRRPSPRRSRRPTASFQQWQVAQLESSWRRSRGRPEGRSERRRPSYAAPPSSSAAARSGPGVDLDDRAWRARRRSRPERRRQVDAPARPARPRSRCRPARRRSSASHPGRSNAAIGYLPQRHGFDSSTRIRGVDLVRLGLDGDRWGLPLAGGRDARARVDEAIELVGAAPYARRPIGECSGGEQQRLLIAQALASRPELLLLDEPLDSLDLPNQTAVSALLGRISRSRASPCSSSPTT